MSTKAPLTSADGAPEQLTLLVTPEVPLQFRLDEQTRRSGLRHVAELRAQIARQASARTSHSSEQRRPIRRLAA